MGGKRDRLVEVLVYTNRPESLDKEGRCDPKNETPNNGYGYTNLPWDGDLLQRYVALTLTDPRALYQDGRSSKKVKTRMNK